MLLMMNRSKETAIFYGYRIGKNHESVGANEKPDVKDVKRYKIPITTFVPSIGKPSPCLM